MAKKPMQLTDAIFDWNGTVLNDLGIVYRSVKLIFETYGLKPPPLAVYQNDISSDYMSSFYWKHGVPERVTAEDVNKIRMAFFEKYWEKPRLFPRVDETVSRLKNLGIPAHIVTSEDREIMLRRIKQFDLKNRFDLICPDAGDKRKKLLSFAHYDVDLHKCVYVDDSADGLVAAKSLGMTTIGVLYGYQPAWRIRGARPSYTALHFHDVQRFLLSLAKGDMKMRFAA